MKSVAPTTSIANGESAAEAPFQSPMQLEVQALDGEAVPARFVAPKASSETTTSRLYIRIGRPQSPIQVLARPSPEKIDPASSSPPAANQSVEPVALRSLRDGDLPQPLADADEWIVEIGNRLNVLEMLRRIDPDENKRLTVVSLDKKEVADHLCDQWYGYEGVDLVAVVGADAFGDTLPDEAAIEALWQWCRQGGTLLIVCGDNAERLIGPDAPLQRFIPAEFVAMRNLRQFVAIENFATAQQRLDFNEANLSLRVPELRNVRGKTDLAETQPIDLPLVIRGALGFGQVIFVGLDLHKPPFSQWVDSPKFLHKVLDRRKHRQSESAALEGGTSQSKRLGFADLGGQLRGALDRFDEIEPIPFWLAALLAAAYITALFPLNYYLCNHWLGRPRLAWLFLPCIATAFAVGSYQLAKQTKGDQLRSNQVDVTDVSVADGLVRGTSWFSLFSPENATFNLTAQPANTQSPDRAAGNDVSRFSQDGRSTAILGWFGLPGTGFGGMSSRTASAALFDQPYTIAPSRGRIDGIPLEIWSSRCFTARWTAETLASGRAGGSSELIQAVEADVARTFDRLLEGQIVSKLEWPLEDCKLLYDRSVYSLGTVTPNQAIRLQRANFQPIDTYLTRRDLYATRENVTPYDRTDFDLQRILEVMMFHQAAGASDYTGLIHRYQRWIDLSHELEYGRAVIVGYGPPGATIEMEGPGASAAKGRHLSIYRFVVPVR